MQSAYCLINFASGNGAGARLAQRLEGYGKVVQLDFDQLSDQLAEASRFECLIIAGGDGTLGTVLAHPALPPKPSILIPLGTANDLCREFGIQPPTSDLAAWLRTVREIWTTSRITIWSVVLNGRSKVMCNYCSFGFEGAVVQSFSRWRKDTAFRSRYVNRLAYAAIGLRHSTRRLPDLRFTDPTGERSIPAGSMSIIVTNIRSYLGLTTTNHTSIADDDRLECIAPRSLLDYAQMVVRGSLGESKTLCGQAPISLSLLQPGTHVQIDGEYAGTSDGSAVTFNILKQVEIFTPIGFTLAYPEGGSSWHL